MAVLGQTFEVGNFGWKETVSKDQSEVFKITQISQLVFLCGWFTMAENNVPVQPAPEYARPPVPITVAGAKAEQVCVQQQVVGQKIVVFNTAIPAWRAQVTIIEISFL